MAATTSTARPARTRAARATKATPAKAAPAKATVAKAEPEVAETPAEVEAYVVDLEYAGDTARYAKFTPPANSGCVGQFYAPLGTKSVRVKISG